MTFNMSYEDLILRNYELRLCLSKYRFFRNASSNTLSVNITELFDPPTEEDEVFARDHIKKERQTPVYAILGALVNENLSEAELRSTVRNLLVGHTACRRVELDERWKMYQKVNERSRNCGLAGPRIKHQEAFTLARLFSWRFLDFTWMA